MPGTTGANGGQDVVDASFGAAELCEVSSGDDGTLPVRTVIHPNVGFAHLLELEMFKGRILSMTSTVMAARTVSRTGILNFPWCIETSSRWGLHLIVLPRSHKPSERGFA